MKSLYFCLFALCLTGIFSSALHADEALTKVTYPVSNLSLEGSTVFFEVPAASQVCVPLEFWQYTNERYPGQPVTNAMLEQAEREYNELMKSPLPQKVYFCPVEKNIFRQKPTSCSAVLVATCRILKVEDGVTYYGLQYPNPVANPGEKPIEGRLFVDISHKPAFDAAVYQKHVYSENAFSVAWQINSAGEVKSQELLIHVRGTPEYGAGTPLNHFLEQFDKEEQQKIQRRKNFPGYFLVKFTPSNFLYAFNNKDPQATPKEIRIDDHGVQADGETVCTWDLFYSGPVSCSQSFPYVLTEDIALYEGTQLAIGLSSITDTTVEFSFRGQSFVSGIDNLELWGDIGSPMAKVLEEQEKTKDGFIEKQGINTLRAKLAKCFTPPLKKSCFKNLIPKKADGLDELDLDRFLDEISDKITDPASLSEAEFLRNYFNNCAVKPLKKRKVWENKVSGVVEGDQECIFEKRKGRWMFIVRELKDDC